MTRNRGLVAVLLATLVAAPALAGCLGSAQASAMDQRDPAQEEAESWSSDAELALVVGLEGEAANAYGGYDGGNDSFEEDYWSRAEEDDSRGDGQAELWGYGFVSESKPDEVFYVVVDADGEVVDTRTDSRDDEEALGEWEVDSDEAAEIAREENEHLRAAEEADNSGFVFVLHEDDDYTNPVWIVAGGGGGDSGGGGGIVIIDAVTGDVLESHGGSYQDGGSGGWDYGR